MERAAQSEIDAKGTLLREIASWFEGTFDELENCMTGDITLAPSQPSNAGGHGTPILPISTNDVPSLGSSIPEEDGG